VRKRLGIVGGGSISRSHLEAALQIDRLEVTAVQSRNPSKARELAARCGARAFTDLDELLATPLDLIAIGSPSGLHAAQGIAASRRGIHVLTEKPIDVTVERADALIRECDRAGVKLGVFFQDRVSPDCRRLKRILDEGRLGKPLLVTAHVRWYRDPAYYGESNWRGTWALDGGGAVMNQGIHTIDLVLWLLGPVGRVYARTGTLLHRIETEDAAVAVLEFESGAIGTFEASTCAYPGQPRRLFVTGDEGTAVLEHNRLVSVDLRGEDGSLADPPPSKGRDASESDPKVSDVAGHRRILEDFIEAIDADRAPVCEGREGRRSVALVEALYRSSQTGRPVEPE
jgi:UDP-N-acetyl-2-amino-2-deoxyglucuronate dehydrogenase